MKHTTWLATLLTGVALGVTLILACSDDSPDGADAATCDCPTAEPPLAGRILRARGTVSIAPNDFGTTAVACPTGATILGGSCRLMNGNRLIYLTEAGIEMGGAAVGYQCFWSSTSNQPDTGIAEAICLMPAP